MDVSKFKVISQNILLVIIAIVPVLFVPLSFLSIEPLKVFIVLITGVLGMLAILLYKIRQDSFFITKNTLFFSIAGVILSTILSTIFSNNLFISLFGRQISATSFLGIVSLFALAYTVFTFFEDTKEKTRLFLTIYVSGICAVLLNFISIVVPFSPTLGFFVNNTVNTVGGWQDLGLFALFITLSSVLVLQFLKHSDFYKKIGWLGFVFGILIMILVNSIMIFVLGILFSLLYIVFVSITQHAVETKKRVSYEALIILVISIVFILIGGKTGIIINSVFNTQVSEVRPSLGQTIGITGSMFQQHSFVTGILGAGVDRFDTAWLLYRPLNVNMSQFWDLDFRSGFSTILSFVVTQGVLGILAWIIFFCVSVYFSVKLLFVQSKQKNDLFMYAYSVFGYLFFFISMTVYTPSIVLTLLMFVFLGFFVSNLKHAKLIQFEEISIIKKPRVSFGYILLLILLLIGFIYAAYIQISQYTSRVMFERASSQFNKDGDLAQVEAKIFNAYFIYGSDMYTRALTEIGLLKINQIIENKQLTQEQAIEQFRGVLESTMGYANASISYDTQSYLNRISLLNVYKNLIPIGVDEAKDEAIKLIDSTSQITPQNPTLFLEKARVHTLVKEYDLAIEEIKKAIEAKPNYIDAVFLLSQIQVEKGEIDQAIQSIQMGIQVDKGNSNLRFQLGLLYYNQQKFNDAVSAFESAIKISPTFANAKYFLGLSYYKNNRTGDAVKVFEDLNTQVPNNQEVQLILNNLKSGLDPFTGAQPPLDNTPEAREELPLEDGEPVPDTENE
jgi:tetratricopeptide (TPR) repeat protein